MSGVRRLALAASTVGLCAAAMSSCGGSSSGGADQVAAGGGPSASSPVPSPGTSEGTCAPGPAKQPTPQTFKSEPPLTISRTTYTATITTNCGPIVVQLDGKKINLLPVLLEHIQKSPQALTEEWDAILGSAAPGARAIFRSAGLRCNYLDHLKQTGAK